MTHYYPDINVVVLEHIATGIDQVVPINAKEYQLLADKTDQFASWQLLCKSLLARVGIDFNDGNWELNQYWVNGECFYG